MIELSATELAERLRTELGLDTRTAHLYRGHDGWVTIVDIDERDDADPLVVSRRHGESAYEINRFAYEVGLTGDGSTRFAASADDIHQVIRLFRREHAEAEPTP